MSTNSAVVLPFLPVAEPDIGLVEEAAVLDAVRSGWISSLGAYITRFEQEFAEFCEAENGVAVSNGTVALHLALVALGVGPGDEVIVPSLTFVATAATVRHAGAEPVFADVDPLTGTLDPAAVHHALSPRTKAIIAVHLYGHPADMGALRDVADAAGVFLIEDAAEAHGARANGRRVGSLGDVATFSFYGNKVLTTGEGGMVVTNNDALTARLRFLRDHAMDPTRRYWHPEIGFNYRLTNVQAAIGVAQLSRYAEITDRRARVLDLYRKSGLEVAHGIVFNPSHAWAEPAIWLVSAVLPETLGGAGRDAVMADLRAEGIDSRPYFIPSHQMPPYVDCRRVAADGSEALIETDRLSGCGISLPSSSQLPAESVQRVAEALERALLQAGRAS